MANQADWSELLDAARAAARYAYAPYSRLCVGAALETASGRVYTGCNIENASYGLSVCAERAALFTAVAAGESAFTRLAVFTPERAALTPCGACRQVLAEFGLTLHIASAGRDGLVREFNLAALLPEAFTLLDPGEVDTV